MKKFYITLFASLLFVTNYATDFVVNSSGQPGTYTTLSAALSAAASSGDRILIPSTITLLEDITINKSIDIMPQTEGNYFYLEGDINITANAGLEIRILGMNLSGNLVCSAGTAVETNRCDLYFIDCNITDPGISELDANVNGLGFHVLYCNIPDIHVYFRFGEIIGSKLKGFYVKPGDGVNYGDTIKIISNLIISSDYFDADTILPNCSFPFYAGQTNYDNDDLYALNVFDNMDHYYFISNNLIKDDDLSSSATLIAFFGTDTITSGGNLINNNTFIGEDGNHYWNDSYKNGYSIECLLNFYDTYQSTAASGSYGCPSVFWERPNTTVINNIFFGGFSNNYSSYGKAIGNGRSNDVSCTANLKSIPFIKYNLFSNGASASNLFPAGNLVNLFPPDFTVDPYNYSVQSTVYTTTNTTFDNNNGKGLTGAVIDGGKNEASSYDIDMTRNDLGTYGGPYSMENYWDSTATGKARIYHLDMPSEIWSGQTPTIKASAVHKK
jgi:hypothetical protein